MTITYDQTNSLMQMSTNAATTSASNI